MREDNCNYPSGDLLSSAIASKSHLTGFLIKPPLSKRPRAFCGTSQGTTGNQRLQVTFNHSSEPYGSRAEMLYKPECVEKPSLRVQKKCYFMIYSLCLECPFYAISDIFFQALCNVAVCVFLKLNGKGLQRWRCMLVFN